MLALCAPLFFTAAAGAANGLLLGLHDEAHSALDTGRTTFATAAELGADVIRSGLYWHEVARERPRYARDSDDPAYRWDRYDAIVRRADALGIRVLFTIHGTPPWANGRREPRYAPRRMADLRAFAYAAASRYSGNYRTPDGDLLPAVDLWSAWNEPNLRAFLEPQWRRIRGRWIAWSPRVYARICNAIVVGVHEARADNVFAPTVACGETAPRGNDNPTGRRPNVSPLRFLRGMYDAGADFDVYAHHAYSARQPPWWAPLDTRWIALGNIDVLMRALTRLYGREMRVWVTEYGYKTNPPDERRGISWEDQASYLGIAHEIAWNTPRIDMLLWYQLRDDTIPHGWASGLLTAGGREKPAFETFRSLQMRKPSPRVLP